jgi:RES domain
MRPYRQRILNPPTTMSAGPWYRVHLANRDPMRFETQGLFRFDSPDDAFETCYLGCTPAAAFLETLGGIRPLPERLVNERAITQLSPGAPVADIADFTDHRFIEDLGLYFDPDVGDYVRADLDRPNLADTFTRRLAASLWRAGYKGLQYFTSHQQRPEEVSIALFFLEDYFFDLGIKASEPEPIDDALLSEMRRRFDIGAFPTDPLPW